jgi:hypothetical protein
LLLADLAGLQNCSYMSHRAPEKTVQTQALLGLHRVTLFFGVILAAISFAMLAGCGYTGSANVSAIALGGSVHGGNQPVSGASVQIYAAGTGGDGSAAQALLSDPVKSDSKGNFSIPAAYRCPSASSPVYIIARGGSPGLAAGNNPALALTAMLGTCGGLSGSSPISVNEVTTVGSVWPLASYMTDATHLGFASGDQSFLAAVASVPEFIDIAQGTSPGVATATSYFAENAKLYSLADVLADCVNSPGGAAGDGSPCGHLFSIATPAGGSAPTDTLTAALRIAQNPTNNVAGIYGMVMADTPFQPMLASAPADWTLTLSYLVATPSISLATGTYSGAQEVTISDSTPGSTIYYTTDGTAPTSTSLTYTGPISIAVSSTLRAIAVLQGSQSSIASSTLTITAARPPAKLAFLQQPSNALTGGTISPAVSVVVEDSSGNTVTGATDPVTLMLTGGTGLAGTLTVPAQNGIATFSNVSVSTAGSYTLSAASPSLTSGTSSSFTISAPGSGAPPPAVKLAFLQQPSNALTQTTISPAATVVVEDSNGNALPGATNAVTLTLTSGTGLTGTLTVIAQNGIATFSSLSVSTAGSYTLSATSPGLASTTSSSFTITAPGSGSPVPAKLAFSQQPTSTATQTTISPAVTVVVEDSNGNAVTGAINPVTLALTSGTGLMGTLTVTPQNGIATFSNLSMTAGGNYSLSATSPGLASAASNGFSISAPSSIPGVTAKSADSFVDSVGINVHFGYNNTPYYTLSSQLVTYLGQLGVRHLRDNMEWEGTTASSPLYAIHNQLGALGIKTDYILTSLTQPMSQVASFAGLVNDMEAVEATNEYDASGDANWVANITAQQTTLYNQIHGSTATKGVTVLAPALAQSYNDPQLGNLSAISDASNLHAYFAGWNPGNPGTGGAANAAYYLQYVNDPGKPTWITETGYYSDHVPYGGGFGVGEALQATYTPRSMFQWWMAGATRSYTYELIDAISSNNFWGLIRYDGTPKPAFYAAKNLLTLLSDPGAPFSPGSLAYSLSGASSQVQQLLFQKRDGSFYLALWVEAAGMNAITGADITVPQQTVLVALGNFPSTVTSYQWDATGTMTTTSLSQSQSVSVSVGPNITVLKIQ